MTTSVRYRSSATVHIRWYAQDSAGAPLTGKTDLFITIQRRSDGFYFDFNGSLTFKAFGSVVTPTQVLTEVDDPNNPGMYNFSWNLATIANATVDDEYEVIHSQTGSDALIPEPGEILVDQWIASFSISVIQGLLLNQFSAGVVGNAFSIKKGDLLPEYPATLVEGGVAKDLSTATSVQIRWTNRDTEVTTTQTASFVVKADGTVKYTWASGDTDTVGLYKVEWIITWAGGETTTYPGQDFEGFRVTEVLS